MDEGILAKAGIRESLDSLEGPSPPAKIPVPAHRVMGPAEWALIIALSVIWGLSFFFIKVIVSAVPPFTVVLGRVALAAAALNILVYARGGACRATSSHGRIFFSWACSTTSSPSA